MVYTVSQINNYIKLLFSRDRNLMNVSISGEVSNCKYHTSGHIYFTVKDEGGQLSCVMFAGKRSGLDFVLKEGQKVIVTGTITVYERDGKYQLYAERIEQQGTGELYERFDKLKRKLEAEGLFVAEHKVPIPKYIRKLGVITASTGAALQDIINITRRRNPYVQIVLYPAKVQGTGAAETLINGIKAMEAARPDVIIIGRGGGSIEDLFEFNDEGLARTIYNCTIPVISAVGHEVDFTICDYVSDLRAPTPSAGAELAVFNYRDFEASLVDFHASLFNLMNRKLDMLRLRSEHYRSEMLLRSPENRLNNYRFRLAGDEEKLKNSFTNRLQNTKHRLAIVSERFDALSPLKKLAGGYSYVTDTDGRNIRSVEDIKSGQDINIRVADGEISAAVTGTIHI